MTIQSNDPVWQPQIDSSEDISIDIRKMLLGYLSHWKWFLISFVVFMASGYVYIQTLYPQYKVAASILIKDHKKENSRSTQEELDLFYKAMEVENELEILRSYTLLDEVVDILNLQVKYAVEEGWRTREVYGDLPVKIEIIAPTEELFSRSFTLQFDGERVIFDGVMYPRNALITESFGSIRISSTVQEASPIVWDNEKPLSVTFIPKNSLVESLHKRLQVSLVKNTSVINLSILSPIPKRGEDFLNHLINVYNKAAIADKNNMAGITLNIIEERLNFVEENLQKAEQSVEQYKRQEGITDISAESSLFLQNIQKNDAELSKVGIQLDILKQVEQYVLSNDATSAPAILGLSDPTIVALIAALNEAEAERIRMLLTNTPGGIRVRAIDDQIKTLKGNLIDNIHVLRRSLETTQRNIRLESRRMESVITSIPKKERELVDITRQQEVINQVYIYLLSKREETAISFAATVADSRIVNAARSTPLPVQPNKRMILMIFGIIGFLFPIVVLWLIDCFQTTLSTKDELEKRLVVPIIGEILFIEQSNKLVVINKNRSKQAEQFRTLRTNIEFMRADGGVKVIMITSSVTIEGKTFLSANLSAAMAISNKKTITLDFDLRKPGLHKVFGIDNNEGLSNFLSGQATLEQVIQISALSDNLHFISAGYVAPNPQELMLGNHLTLLFEQLKEKYDCIIIDTSPAGLMSDAMILNRFADVTLYVVRQSCTPKDRINFINELSRSKRLGNMGIVVNGIKNEKWHGYGYGYGSYKYYAKYYGIGEEEQEEQE